MQKSLQKNKALRPLGRSGIQITALGLGTWQFSGGQGGAAGVYWPALPPTEMDAIVRKAWEGGINWFDTAEAYGDGGSERNLAHGLQAAGVQKGEVVIATKWWPILRGAASLKSTIDERLGYLEGYGIDLYQIHQPYSFSSVKSQMDAMADLVAAGKIKAIGVSNFSSLGMRQAHEALAARGLTLASNQVHYSLLHRSIEKNGVLDTARELGVTVIAWSPLEQGILTGRYHHDPGLLDKLSVMRKSLYPFGPRQLEKSRPLIEELEKIGLNYGVNAAQVALNWLINFHGDTVVAIPGASRVNHAEENAAVLNFKLTDKEMERLDILSIMNA